MPKSRLIHPMTVLLAALLTALPALAQSAPRTIDGSAAATLDEYHQRRLIMLDNKARLIGPPSLGYDWEDFNRRRGRRYHFVFGKRMRSRIRTIEFDELVGDPTFTAVIERAMERARSDRKAGWAFVAGGAAALATGVAMNSIGVADSDLSPVLFGGVPLLASGITFFVVGASLDVQSRKRMRKIRGFDFSELMPRDRGWTSMESYNSALRLELGLPDEEALDAAEDPDLDPIRD